MDGALTVEPAAQSGVLVRRLRVGRWPLTVRLAAAVAAVCVAAAISPRALELLRHTPPLCGFRVLTGLPCPGCGTTRAVLELGSGHPISSLLLNPLGAFVWLYALALLARWVGLLPRPAFQKASGTLVFTGAACAIVAWLAILTHHFLT